jgi:hypothetical protein
MRAINFLVKHSSQNHCEKQDTTNVMPSSQLVIGCSLRTQRDTTHPNEKHFAHNRRSENGHSTSIEKKQVPDSKYPSQLVIRVRIEKGSLDQWKLTQKMESKSNKKQARRREMDPRQEHKLGNSKRVFI